MMNFSGNRFILLLLVFVTNLISAKDSLSLKSETDQILTFNSNNPNIYVSEGVIIFVDGKSFSEDLHKTPKKIKSAKRIFKKNSSTKKNVLAGKYKKPNQHYCKSDQNKKIEIYNATSKICVSNISQFFLPESTSYYKYIQFFVKNSVKVKSNLFCHSYRISFYPVRPPPFII